MCGRLCPSRPTLDHLECIHRAACACNAIALVRIILLPALSWGNASTPAGRLRLPYPEALKLMWLDASVPAHLPTETVPLGMCRHPPQDTRMSCESATVMRAHGCSAVLAKSPPWLSSSFVPKFISALYRRYPP
jgi:hypothetical protein